MIPSLIDGSPEIQKLNVFLIDLPSSFLFSPHENIKLLNIIVIMQCIGLTEQDTADRSVSGFGAVWRMV